MLMAVVADDVTGSNDIGIMFAKSGCLTHVYAAEAPRLFLPPAAGGVAPAPDIAILDTNSRLDPPEVAYRKVYAATRQLRRAGYRQFHNKTCSVFRGNIGAEFDAMLDALGLEFAVVVLGFPKNGRTTIDGIHYVHGKKLEDSEFRHDPIHPMRRSDLVGILQSQTRRKVGLITRAVVAQGAAALRQRIASARGECQYVILDVTDQAALATIAQAVCDETVLCGSSAIAEELPGVWGIRPAVEPSLDLPHLAGVGLLVTAGSLMPQTAQQIAYLKDRGVSCSELDTDQLLDPASREAEITRLASRLADRLLAGEDAVCHSPNQPRQVESTRQAGSVRGLSPTEVSRRVSAALAEVTARVLERTGQNRLVVAGGETSAAVCARLGVSGMRVWKEIQPGLPSCVSLGDPPRLLVLKSGSFGRPDFFAQALDHLKGQ